MPYDNVPENMWDKMDSCVEKVMAGDGSLDKPAAVAICYTTIMEGKSDAAKYGFYLDAQTVKAAGDWE